MAYTCAVYPTATRRWRRRSPPSSSSSRRSSALKPGHAAARRRLRLGRHGHARRGRARRQGARRDALAQPGRVGAGRDRARGLGELAEVRYLRLPRRAGVAASTRSAPSGSPSTSARHSLPSYFASLATGCGREGGCSTTASPSRARRSKRKLDPFIARYVFPDGQLRAGRPHRDRDERRRVRDPARGEPARALRADAARLGPQPRRALGRGRRRGRRSAGPGCGGCTWPRARLGFERNNIQLHQVLGVRVAGHGGSGFPLRGWR